VSPPTAAPLSHVLSAGATQHTRRERTRYRQTDRQTTRACHSTRRQPTKSTLAARREHACSPSIRNDDAASMAHCDAHMSVEAEVVAAARAIFNQRAYARTGESILVSVAAGPAKSRDSRTIILDSLCVSSSGREVGEGDSGKKAARAALASRAAAASAGEEEEGESRGRPYGGRTDKNALAFALASVDEAKSVPRPLALRGEETGSLCSSSSPPWRRPQPRST